MSLNLHPLTNKRFNDPVVITLRHTVVSQVSNVDQRNMYKNPVLCGVGRYSRLVQYGPQLKFVKFTWVKSGY